MNTPEKNADKREISRLPLKEWEIRGLKQKVLFKDLKRCL
jgi:hypothetical protein